MNEKYYMNLKYNIKYIIISQKILFYDTIM